MSAPDALYDGLFKQKGICRVFDIDDLLEVANLFTRYESPTGDRVAVLSSSGGAGALMGDLAFDAGLRLPGPSRKTLDQLSDLIPSVGAIANPMDITTQFMNDPEVIARYLQAFADDENFDVLILTLTISTPDKTLRIAERIATLSPSLPKPLVICWPAGIGTQQAFKCLEKARVPLFFHPARCMDAIGHFVRYGISKKKRQDTHNQIRYGQKTQ
jgi:acetyltransferase